jgi:hypothetical protein
MAAPKFLSKTAKPAININDGAKCKQPSRATFSLTQRFHGGLETLNRLLVIRSKAKHGLKNYFTKYNQYRPHLALDDKTPDEWSTGFSYTSPT